MTNATSALRWLISASMLSLPAIVGNLALAQSKEPFTFGVALPTTGSAAPFGLDQVQALEWAIADINAGGGAGGRKLVAVVLDTQARPQVGIDVVSRLISVEKVPLVITA